MKMKILPDGTLLYHGTDKPEKFTEPKGPAWFCLNYGVAAPWAGWGLTPAGGERRVLVQCTRRDIQLLDTTMLVDWQRLGAVLCGCDDPLIWDMVAAVQKAGYAGWYGKSEIMLCDTSVVTFIDTMYVPDNIPPHGRPR